MNQRKVSIHLRKKLSEWIDTIEDEVLREAVKTSVFVTGGCVNSLLLSEQVSDYDIYFTSHTVAHKLVLYYLRQFNELNGTKIIATNVDYTSPVDPSRVEIDGFDFNRMNGKSPPNGTTYFPVFVSNNAITLTDDIQIIIRFIGQPAEVHKNFDFVHCTNYYDYGLDNLVLNVDALASILTKELRYHGSLYPVASLFRTRKFLDRGYTISAGTLTKIAYDISGLDLSDVDVLREQILGVDTSTMLQVLSELENRGIHVNGRSEVTAETLFDIIDNHF